MILLVGAGFMAKDYVNVLDALNQKFLIVGRGEESAARLEEGSRRQVVRGGLENYLNSTSELITSAIVSVGVDELAKNTMLLIRHGIKHILVEKPAALSMAEIKQLAMVSEEYKVNLYVGYNRRFYSSVVAAKKIIEQDGGVQSYHFEITERSHVIQNIQKHEKIKENWFLANTTHVVDLAFFLGGAPEVLTCFTAGTTSWHSRSAVFSGAGKAFNGALFSYIGNWGAPGGWGVEIQTKIHRLIFKPLEKLQIQKLGSSNIDQVGLNDNLDIHYKPGLYLQLHAFLNNENTNLCSISEHFDNVGHYLSIAGYN